MFRIKHSVIRQKFDEWNISEPDLWRIKHQSYVELIGPFSFGRIFLSAGFYSLQGYTFHLQSSSPIFQICYVCHNLHFGSQIIQIQFGSQIIQISIHKIISRLVFVFFSSKFPCSNMLRTTYNNGHFMRMKQTNVVC